MRNALIFIKNIDQLDTVNAILEKIPLLQKNWNRDTLNVMCWSAGAISGALNNDIEKKFLIQIIHQLLNIKATISQDDKAIIASCIMFICTQYPKFLVSNWEFLKTITNKLFEFMNSEMDGIQRLLILFIKYLKNAEDHLFVHIKMTKLSLFIIFYRILNQLLVIYHLI